MALQIVRNNIVNVTADAIVNTANPDVAIGSGVDSAIYEAAGSDRLLEDRRKIGPMEPGEVAYTPAYGLDAKYIIHAIGPAWMGGGYGEREIVAKCYRGSLGLAKELGCESIAFPLMATGTYGFPKDEALRIAIREISAFLLTNEMEVLLVVYDRESFEVSGRLFSDIRSFIEDTDVVREEEHVYPVSSMQGSRRRVSVWGGRRRRSEPRKRIPEAEERALEAEESEPLLHGFSGSAMAPLEDEFIEADEAAYAASGDSDYFGSTGETAEREKMSAPFPSETESLEERLRNLDKTFQEYLFMLIDRKGVNDPDVYKKANIDRKHFSKIRSNKDYVPSKKTALALAIALELSLDETRDLLRRAGLALSPSSMFDNIVEYCIDNGEYDIYDINCVLFKYGQDTLGV